MVRNTGKIQLFPLPESALAVIQFFENTGDIKLARRLLSLSGGLSKESIHELRVPYAQNSIGSFLIGVKHICHHGNGGSDIQSR